MATRRIRGKRSGPKNILVMAKTPYGVDGMVIPDRRKRDETVPRGLLAVADLLSARAKARKGQEICGAMMEELDPRREAKIRDDVREAMAHFGEALAALDEIIEP